MLALAPALLGVDALVPLQMSHVATNLLPAVAARALRPLVVLGVLAALVLLRAAQQVRAVAAEDEHVAAERARDLLRVCGVAQSGRGE